MRALTLLSFIACSTAEPPVHDDAVVCSCVEQAVPGLHEELFAYDGVLALSAPPVLDPWSIVVRVDRELELEQTVTFLLPSCHASEVFEDPGCRAMYLPAPNQIEILDFDPEPGDRVRIRYHDREVSEALDDTTGGL